MIGFVDAIKMFFARYVDFEGRSTRAEYWWIQLFMLIVVIVLGGLGLVTGGDFESGDISTLGMIFFGLLGLFFLACIIPGIAVTVRRFHDQDKSGWMYLLSFIPYVGGIVIIVFMCLRGTEGPNRFGQDPFDNMFEVFE